MQLDPIRMRGAGALKSSGMINIRSLSLPVNASETKTEYGE